MSGPFTVSAIGCSGPVPQHFVKGFADHGVTLRILARRPEAVCEQYLLPEPRPFAGEFSATPLKTHLMRMFAMIP